MAKKKKHEPDTMSADRGHVLNLGSPFSVSEAYKTARTNLLFMKSGDGCQKIAVTSSLESEGKSVNCINLAITLSQNGLRVLIIDADLRRSRVHRLLDFKPKGGLSELLAGIIDINSYKNAIYQTQYENLFVLPAGLTPPNPSELLASKQMRALMNRLSEEFDYIMMDTPPVCVITDATVLSNVVDGYVFVVRNNQTPINAIKESVTRLKQVKANIIGFIYNDAGESSSYKKYYGKYKRYGYYKYGYYSRYGKYSGSAYEHQETDQ